MSWTNILFGEYTISIGGVTMTGNGGITLIIVIISAICWLSFKIFTMKSSYHSVNISQPNYCPSCKRFTTKTQKFAPNHQPNSGRNYYYKYYICGTCSIKLKRSDL